MFAENVYFLKCVVALPAIWLPMTLLPAIWLPVHFSEELSEATKLHIYCGMASTLQPVVQTAEQQKIMSSIHGTDEYLNYGSMTGVIRDVNTEMRKEKKSLYSEHQSDAISRSCENTWDTSMVVEVKKVDAEKILNSKGVKGSFLVRPSERSKGDFALAFRTHTDIRHWRIVFRGGSYYVHPRPNPYNSLEDIIVHFQEAVCQETGLEMIPLQLTPPSSPPSASSKDRDMMESSMELSMELVESGSVRPGQLSVPTQQNGPITCAPSRSMSRLNPANLTSWSVDDVCFWLISHGFGNFIDTFRDNEVDGECLLTLDNKLLRDDLGITALGQRSRILKRVESLKKEIHPD